MFCTNCGQQIDDNSAFCTNCGKKTASAQRAEPIQNAAVTPAAKVQSSNAQPQNIRVTQTGNKNGKSKVKPLLIIGAVIVVIIFLLNLSTGDSLQNTTWISDDSDINTLGALSMFGGGPGAFEIITIDFGGDGNFRWGSESFLFGLPVNSASDGRYTISGSDVTLNKENGEVLHGKIIGNTMQIGNLSFRRSR